MYNFKNIFLSVFLFGMGITAQAQLTNDGIYAIFDTTLGSFTSEIYYAEAPMAAANFIGLAEGSLDWIDAPSGRLNQGPFYDGIIFHRVIDGFVIQGGSPNGQGTDGPGYVFKDEFNPALLHTNAGIFSMANSGDDSNGSQFFITLAPTPHLDNIHMVFGEVIDGLSVVQAIGDVDTDCIVLGTNGCSTAQECFFCPTCTECSNRPVTDVVMNSVQILRIGTAAQAFDPSTNNIPICQALEAAAGHSASNSFLQFQASSNQNLYISESTNLVDWTHSANLYLNNSGSVDLPWQIINDTEYVTLSEVVYPDYVLQGSINQQRINLLLTGQSFTNIVCEITRNVSVASPTYTSGFTNHPSGSQVAFSNPPLYTPQSAYKASFNPVLLNPSTGPHIFLRLILDFNSQTNGVISGSYFPDLTINSSETVSGTFTIQDL